MEKVCKRAITKQISVILEISLQSILGMMAGKLVVGVEYKNGHSKA